MTQTKGTDESKAACGFRLCLGRLPRDQELKKLVGLYETAQSEYGSEPEMASQMAMEPGQVPPESEDTIELAAWTAVGNVLLNLDEMLMRP